MKVVEPDAFVLPHGPLIRQSGFGLGQVRGEDGRDLVQKAIELAGKAWDEVHVYQRDTHTPGDRGFEPGNSSLAQEIRALFRDQTELPTASAPIRTSDGPSKILDVILVEPNQWLVGHHLANELFQTWPGGCPQVSLPPEIVSRAYLKMAEAILWSELPLEAGDTIVEIGSSPGGASQRLLDAGLKVTGVDAAEMDPRILAHPKFTHWRGKSASFKRKDFARFRWLAADANVAPNYTLEAIEDIVTYPSSRFEGLILTMKLTDYALIDRVPEWTLRVRKWGFRNVRVRQLAHNRKECCLVAAR